MAIAHKLHENPRRRFLNRIATLAVSIFAGFIHNKTGLAARNTENFLSNPYQETLKSVLGQQDIIDSNLLDMSLPEIAENGSVVPLTISSELETIDKLYVLVEKNPTPLALEVEFSVGVPIYLTARLKMAESSMVVIFARNGTQWLKTQKWVKVVVGGCGTG